MFDVGPGIWDRYRYRVADARPGSAQNKWRSLRLVNPTDEWAHVAVTARGDRRRSTPEGWVNIYLLAGTTREVSVKTLVRSMEGFVASQR